MVDTNQKRFNVVRHKDTIFNIEYNYPFLFVAVSAYIPNSILPFSSPYTKKKQQTIICMHLRISRDMSSVEYDRFLQANGMKPK